MGAANLTSSLFVHTGCVPVFGSVTRMSLALSIPVDLADGIGSRLNGSTGGRTQMSSIITGILIVLSIFFLLPWLYFLPKVRGISVCQADNQAVLAAIVVLVVYASKSETSPRKSDTDT